MNDLPERAVIRAEGRALLALAAMTFALLVIEALLLFAWPAQAEEWNPPDLPCVPTVSDFEREAAKRAALLAEMGRL